jgi:hypothetical protein
MSKEEIMATGEFNFDDVMRIGSRMQDNHVVPVLGFSWDTQKVGEYDTCAYARGFIVQPRAPGKELYDGVRYMYEYKSEEAALLIDYTKKYAQIPPKHFAEFVKNYIAISQELAVDPSKRGNFFYDEQEGFYFIDLNFHKDDRDSAEKLVEDSVKYSMGQFRTIYDGTFKQFPEDEQEAYATASKEIFANIARGFTMAGISRELIEREMQEHIQDNEIFKSVGVESAGQLIDEALSQQEEKVQ